MILPERVLGSASQNLMAAGVAIANGQVVPAKAVKLMAKPPIPWIPLGLWQWLFIRMAKHYWQQGSAGRQISEEALLAQPDAEVQHA